MLYYTILYYAITISHRTRRQTPHANKQQHNKHSTQAHSTLPLLEPIKHIAHYYYYYYHYYYYYYY